MSARQDLYTRLNLQVATEGESELIRLIQRLEELSEGHQGAAESASAETRALYETIRAYERATERVREFSDLTRRMSEQDTYSRRDVSTLAHERQITESSMRAAGTQYQYYRRMFPDAFTRIGQTRLAEESDQGMFEWFRRSTGETMGGARETELGIRQQARTDQELEREERRQQREEDRADREERRRLREEEREAQRERREDERRHRGLTDPAQRLTQSILSGMGIVAGLGFVGMSVHEYLQQSRRYGQVEAMTGFQYGQPDITNIASDRQGWWTRRERIEHRAAIAAVVEPGRDRGAVEATELYARAMGMTPQQLLPSVVMARMGGGKAADTLNRLFAYTEQFDPSLARASEFQQAFSGMAQFLGQFQPTVNMEPIFGFMSALGAAHPELRGARGAALVAQPLLEATSKPQGEYREALLFRMMSEEKGGRLEPWEYELAKEHPEQYMHLWLRAAPKMAHSLGWAETPDTKAYALKFLAQVPMQTAIEIYKDKAVSDALQSGDYTAASVAAEEVQKRQARAVTAPGYPLTETLETWKLNLGGLVMPSGKTLGDIREGLDAAVSFFSRTATEFFEKADIKIPESVRGGVGSVIAKAEEVVKGNIGFSLKKFGQQALERIDKEAGVFMNRGTAPVDTTGPDAEGAAGFIGTEAMQGFARSYERQLLKELAPMPFDAAAGGPGVSSGGPLGVMKPYFRETVARTLLRVLGSKTFGGALELLDPSMAAAPEELAYPDSASARSLSIQASSHSYISDDSHILRAAAEHLASAADSMYGIHSKVAR